jgi:hypothetical protein
MLRGRALVAAVGRAAALGGDAGRVGDQPAEERVVLLDLGEPVAALDPVPPFPLARNEAAVAGIDERPHELAVRSVRLVAGVVEQAEPGRLGREALDALEADDFEAEPEAAAPDLVDQPEDVEAASVEVGRDAVERRAELRRRTTTCFVQVSAWIRTSGGRVGM